jgi:hypothetical protein
MQQPTPDAAPTDPPPKRRGRGGRPKNDPGTVRAVTIGVRVSPTERDALHAKAEQMGMTPAHWLRDAALSRRLPSPPVPAINLDQYAELARLAANLNQLARAANEGRPVTVDAALLQRLAGEVGRLRLALIGAGGRE